MIAIVAVAAMLVAGCQTVKHDTPSGKPEVSIRAPSKDVKTALVGTLVNLGYSIKHDSDFQIVLERPVDNVMANVLLGSQYDPTVEARVTATFLEMNGSTRVISELGIVRNGGSAFEQVDNFNNSRDSQGIQNIMADIKVGLEARKPLAQVVADAVAASELRKAEAQKKKAS